ncbi:MAG: hypothetical protein EB141_08825 [Verrucomicrobia bacterium]|nr:hypothetical protein [Verrucomicrobiota bacterium]NBU09178.1 hypothetical protein [Pseudomonadota bacterium]NDA67055.1 hypothetical protein [Verrucomicrobiota bacterium]NDB75733.1 hypothetical protein [Verrucomicrobiota bacterium]NDD39054.1 hypothetical protein [Verrucomicrobiota bacterium]
MGKQLFRGFVFSQFDGLNVGRGAADSLCEARLRVAEHCADGLERMMETRLGWHRSMFRLWVLGVLWLYLHMHISVCIV